MSEKSELAVGPAPKRRKKSGKLSPIDLLDLPAILAETLKRVVRKNEISLEQAAVDMQVSAEEMQAIMDELMAKGYVTQGAVKEGIYYYKAHFGKANYFGHKPGKIATEVWSALDDL